MCHKSLLLQLPTQRRRADADKSRMHDAEFVSAMTFRDMHTYIMATRSDFYINNSYHDMYH